MTWTAPELHRDEPPEVADESTSLPAFLDYHRQTLLWKCAGLTGEQLKLRAVPSSTLSLLGLVRHLTDVERSWFRRRFAGEPVEMTYSTDEEPDADFDDLDSAGAEAVLAAYLAEIEACLLGLPGDAPYSVTKHAAVGFAEWLAFSYRPRGVRVSALCPYGVRTGLLMPAIEAGHIAGDSISQAGPILEPAEVAESVVTGLADERFLILPHPEVGRMYSRKAADPDAWIAEQAEAVSRRRENRRQNRRQSGRGSRLDVPGTK